MSPHAAEHFAKDPETATSPAPDAAVRASWPRRLLAVLCGVILLVMMGLTVVDVIGRYVFNSPLVGATELTELLLAAVVFIGLPAVSLDDEHVTVDLLTSRLPDWVQPWRKLVLALVTSAVLAVVGWRLWVYGSQIASYNGVTNSLRLPVAPVTWLCALCTFVAVAVTLYVALRDVLRR
ncbi:TRAP transporter small permease [Maritimibacter alkaliphilus]|uniref:TRAP transporter small permease n=1 Tax=Maritimibacter alkaliphilus TaxID=404236 RepID=UPI001C952DDB|nr:TRAP transporter small permease [Maritimibacter alkaliphilus]MBY6091890.1 TRAP transporter small permease [Maritimibacter alkaliphilus]